MVVFVLLGEWELRVTLSCDRVAVPAAPCGGPRAHPCPCIVLQALSGHTPAVCTVGAASGGRKVGTPSGRVRRHHPQDDKAPWVTST